MSTAITKYETQFDGHNIGFHPFRGKVAVIAADLGRALGYADDGKKLVDVLRQEWAEEAIAGTDFDVLEGDDLREFKALLGDTQERWVSSTARLMILYESGVDLVCLKTEKPAGKKLRRYLADEVLPKLRRGKAVLPTAKTPVFAPAHEPTAQLPLSPVGHVLAAMVEVEQTGDIAAVAALGVVLAKLIPKASAGKLAATVAAASRDAIVDALQSEGGIVRGAVKLRKLTGLSPIIANAALRKLMDDGLVINDGNEHQPRYRLVTTPKPPRKPYRGGRPARPIDPAMLWNPPASTTPDAASSPHPAPEASAPAGDAKEGGNELTDLFPGSSRLTALFGGPAPRPRS